MTQFENPKTISKKSALKNFSEGNINIICDTLLSITYHEKDWEWCQEQCLHFLDHDNSDVRGLAATCLGHLARIHHKLDKQRVIDALNKHLTDDTISGQVHDALDDIDIYVK